MAREISLCLIAAFGAGPISGLGAFIEQDGCNHGLLGAATQARSAGLAPQPQTKVLNSRVSPGGHEDGGTGRWSGTFTGTWHRDCGRVESFLYRAFCNRNICSLDGMHSARKDFPGNAVS